MCRACRRTINTGEGETLISWGIRVYHKDCYLEWLEDRILKMQDRLHAYGLRPRAQRTLEDLLDVRKIYEERGELPPLQADVTS